MSHKQSIEFLREYLEPKGYIFEEQLLGLKKTEYTFIKSPSGGGVVFASKNPLYPFATSSARLISKDKLKSYDLMRRTGVVSPKTVVIDRSKTEYRAALQLIQECSSVIVKPFDGSGSSGLTLDVHTPRALDEALTKALTKTNVALVQEQFVGEEVRFVVLSGIVRAAVLRQKPRLVGDGVSTIRELIESENRIRRSLDNMAVRYPELTGDLIDEVLLQDTSIPVLDQIVELNKSTMISGGASIYNILESIDPSYVQIAEKATSQIGNGFIVVDMMIADSGVPATTENYVFIEMNLAPALALFYSCRDGKHFHIVEEYLGPMLEGVINKVTV